MLCSFFFAILVIACVCSYFTHSRMHDSRAWRGLGSKVTNYKQTVLLFNQVRNTSTTCFGIWHRTGQSPSNYLLCSKEDWGGGDKDDSKKIKGNAFFVHPIENRGCWFLYTVDLLIRLSCTQSKLYTSMHSYIYTEAHSSPPPYSFSQLINTQGQIPIAWVLFSVDVIAIGKEQ